MAKKIKMGAGTQNNTSGRSRFASDTKLSYKEHRTIHFPFRIQTNTSTTIKKIKIGRN